MEMLSAYTLPTPTSDQALTLVGRGTPMGELLRRYWHPVALSGDATSTPRIVTALGERLVLFRDGEGRAGLLHERCAHRGTSLYYGKVDNRGCSTWTANALSSRASRRAARAPRRGCASRAIRCRNCTG